MAMNEVEMKLLGKLAKQTGSYSPLLSSTLFKILGLSVLLSRRLVRARQVRKLDTTRDTKSLALYHHIIWLSREGLNLTETYILPFSQQEMASAELRVFAAKLRASFYHVFCLFHNNPAVNSLILTSQANTSPGPTQGGPLSPKPDNGQKSLRSTEGAAAAATESKQSPDDDKENAPDPPRRQITPSRARQAALRETIPSMASEASYITNPYVSTVTPPPGLKPLPSIPQPSSFLLPSINYVPTTSASFSRALQLAASVLPGSSPLRLSVSLEYCAFLWDCLHDHEGCRRVARRTIQDVYRAEEGMDDAEFEDAKLLVGTLGRMMRRQPADATPKLGEETPPSAREVGVNVPLPPLPDVQMSGVSAPPRTSQPPATTPSTRANIPQGEPRTAAAPTSPNRRGATTSPKGSPPRTTRSRGGNGSKSPRGSGSSGRRGGDRRGGGSRDSAPRGSVSRGARR